MLFLFLIWVLVEVGLIVLVAELIGVFWMLVLLVASWPIGLSVIRHEGRTAMTRLNTAVNAGRTPTDEVIEGALAMFGGLLFMIPGFLTDIVGGVLLIGPARQLIGKWVARSKRVGWLHRGAGWVGSTGAGFGARGPQSYDAESTAHDVNDRQIGREKDL
jgi:UPF0716 protein FxsA